MSDFERLSAPAESAFPDEWYRADHAEHFWFRWRLRALKGALARSGIPEAAALKALDVGCGVGAVRAQLEACTRWTVDGADLSPYALSHQLPARGRTLLYDIRDERPELLGAYDIALAFDVLEHVPDPSGFLTSLSRHLRPGGWLLVNVPAQQWLYSAYDSSQGHRRRYSRRDLLAEVAAANAGLLPVHSQYWGFALTPVAFTRKLLLGARASRESSLRLGFNQPNRILRAVMLALMAAETRICPRPPLGTSVLAIFRKAATE